VRAGLRYLAGLQLGLALVAALTASGIAALLTGVPTLWRAMSLASLGYLALLAIRIGAAPVGASAERAAVPASARSGFWLGLTNPKAYLAFASLMASATLLQSGAAADAALKAALCVAVALSVDLAWILVGAALHHASLPPVAERVMNLAFAAMILAAAVLH
jgi:threonine/homoserine/homoserine lactone efflux protein